MMSGLLGENIKKVILFFMPPTLKKEHIGFGLSGRACVHASVQNKIQARDLKFHILIPRQKIAYPYFFLV